MLSAEDKRLKVEKMLKQLDDIVAKGNNDFIKLVKHNKINFKKLQHICIQTSKNYFKALQIYNGKMYELTHVSIKDIMKQVMEIKHLRCGKLVIEAQAKGNNTMEKKASLVLDGKSIIDDLKSSQKIIKSKVLSSEMLIDNEKASV